MNKVRKKTTAKRKPASRAAGVAAVVKRTDVEDHEASVAESDAEEEEDPDDVAFRAKPIVLDIHV